MGHKVKLKFGNYSLSHKGSLINFKVGEWVDVPKEVAQHLKGVGAGIEDKTFSYFDVESTEDIDSVEKEVLKPAVQEPEKASEAEAVATKKSKNTKK